MKIEILSCCFSIDEGDISVLNNNFAFSLALSISVELIVKKTERKRLRIYRYQEYLSFALSEKS